MGTLTDAPNGWLFIRSPDDSVRYVLGEAGSRMLGFFGINPSTARPDNLDQTLRRVRGFARAWGYDGWVMFNVYPVRMTAFEQLEQQERRELHLRNLSWIRENLDNLPIRSICCAWGNHIDGRTFLFPFLYDIAEILADRGLSTTQIGPDSTKLGHPPHPCRISGSLAEFPFDLKKYLKSRE